MEELGQLLENLQSQSQQLEATITTLAQSFTAAAEAQPPVNTPPPAEPAEPSEPESEDSQSTATKPKRRRGGMFGNELTLDD